MCNLWPQAKGLICQLLPQGLGDKQSRVRATVVSCVYTMIGDIVTMVMWQAYAISAIARWDWPDEWPDLFNQLVQAVGSGNRCLVHGAMRVLTGKERFYDHHWLPWLVTYCDCIEFCQEVTDQQMPHVAPIIFPQLLQVITQPQVIVVCVCVCACVRACVHGCVCVFMCLCAVLYWILIGYS